MGTKLFDLVVVVDEERGAALLHWVGDLVLDLGVLPLETLVNQVAVPATGVRGVRGQGTRGGADRQRSGQ